MNIHELGQKRKIVGNGSIIHARNLNYPFQLEIEAAAIPDTSRRCDSG
jgi:hypothetical protein